MTLCVSLHAPNDVIRRQTMPVANTWTIREILEACRNYIRETGRRVIFEYALADGVNAGVSEETVREFMKILENRHISVTRRREMGDDIEGACGQLRRKVISG